MLFTLYYSGPLKANGDKKHKHMLRQAFHAQLANLWRQEPLCLVTPPLSHKSPHFREINKQGTKHGFSALVPQGEKAVVDLDISMLRPGEPGKIISQGGDIDNRLKTLFDALSIPQENQIIDSPQKDQNQIMNCLLEDDRLIASISVETHQWLQATSERDVVLLIRVRTRVIMKWGENWVLL